MNKNTVRKGKPPKRWEVVSKKTGKVTKAFMTKKEAQAFILTPNLYESA